MLGVVPGPGITAVNSKIFAHTELTFKQGETDNKPMHKLNRLEGDKCYREKQNRKLD